MCLENIKEVSSALLVPLLGIATITILVLQYLLAKSRAKSDRFQLRFPIYEATKKYLGLIMQQGTANNQQPMEFMRNTKGSEFLFGKDINDYLKELYKKGVEIETKGTMINSRQTSDAERSRLIDKKRKLFDWFQEQFDVSEQLFSHL